MSIPVIEFPVFFPAPPWVFGLLLVFWGLFLGVSLVKYVVSLYTGAGGG